MTDIPETEIYDNEKIHKIIDLYKKSRARDKLKYDKRKSDPVYVEQNRQRSRAYYIKNKESKQNEYAQNQDFRKHRSLFNYYKYNDRLDEFMDKYPDRVTFLQEHGFKVQ